MCAISSRPAAPLPLSSAPGAGAKGPPVRLIELNRPGFSGGGFLPSEGFQTVLL
jgi:hypothetical protein